MVALARGHRSFPILVAVTFNKEYEFGKGRGKCRWDFIGSNPERERPDE